MVHARTARRFVQSFTLTWSIPALMVACFAGSASAGDIRWQSGTVSLAAKTPPQLQADIAALAARTGKSHVVVQFDQPLTKAQRAALVAAGLEPQSYLSDNAYFATLAPGGVNAASLAGIGGVVDVRAVDRNWKLHPAFINNDIPTWARLDKVDAEGKRAPIGADELVVAAIVQFHKDVTMQTDGVALVRKHGGSVRSKLRSINSIVVEMPLSHVAALADEDGVMWIEPPLPPMTELNDNNRARVGAEIVNDPPYNLDGSGVTVLVYDSANALASHTDFGGRLTARDAEGTSDHSTHVAGTIGGSGAASGGTFRGMAPAVIMESYGFDVPGGLQPGFLYTDPGDLEANYNEAINVHGVEISNNSIGSNVEPNGYNCAWQGDYGTTAQLIDAIVGGSLGEPFRVVWAAGNERQGSRCDVEGFGDYYSIAPPGCAKNQISVGALNSNDDSVTSFTSWGPTDDGRIKPDVSGPGCQSNGDGGVTSCSSSGGYNVKCGTSMASPTVCGVGALFLQEYHNLFPGEPDPLGSTLKAILIHAAEDVESTGPDYRTGYGSVRAPATIDLLRSANFLEGEVDQGQSALFLVIVGPTDNTAKITLVWDDAPGTPNVSPSLVNDLDLRVFDSGSTQHFPWTLNPANPSAPAVRTQEDHLNNIEQVTIDAPTPGAYTIEIRGTNVPSGPQKFTLVAEPLLVACSSQGVISLDRSKYACSSTATIQVVDCDLNTDDGSVQTVSVSITSDSEPGGETVLLTETAPETATFRGTIGVDTADSAGVLLVADGDNVTASYIDADDGMGGVNVTVTSMSVVDCSPPVISNVQTTGIEPRSATVTFSTDELANATLHYGTSCGALSNTLTSSGFRTSHTFNITGLNDNTTYYYAVDAADEASNAASDNNGGSCYSFSTPEVPDFFTEEFGGGHDLTDISVMFTPNGSTDFYAACAMPITELPTDPSGGTSVSLSDDDSELINLTGGATVLLYGSSYGSLYIGSNGYLTFTGSDSDYSETLEEHFEQPRVSGHYDDLNPSVGGQVSWKQSADRVAVTWLNVPEYNVGGSNTFQIELFFDGRISINKLALSSSDAIVGLSEGEGLSPDYLEFDLSAAGDCTATPPTAENQTVETNMDTPVVIALTASDDGEPNPPGALTYVIDSLPTGTLRDTGTGAIIMPGALPYTLSSGGNEATYNPDPGYIGGDSFTFFADDGGVAPEGGPSNTATVSIVVGVFQQIVGYPFDSSPGWTIENNWKFGMPIGGGSHSGDPVGGFTGDSVYGFALSGDYANSLAATYYLTMPPFDCSECTSTQLRFRRWLGIEAAPNDNAMIEASADGVIWTPVWEHTGAAIDESAWSLQIVDLSAVADGASAVHLRWGIGPTNGSVTYPGWNIDDVEIWAVLAGGVFGDFDGDGDVDLSDFSEFSLCFGGPNVPPAGSCPPGIDADFDNDGDVDLSDFAQFSLNFTGPL